MDGQERLKEVSPPKTFISCSPFFLMLLLKLKTADIHRQTQLIKLSNLNKLRC